MSQALRINTTDPRMSLLGDWESSDDQGVSCYTDCQFFLMFRGTGIKIHCISHVSKNITGVLRLELDGDPLDDIGLNGTSCIDGITPKYRQNLVVGDHQVAGRVLQMSAGERFEMVDLEIENSTGDGFDLLSAGPTAQNVPAQAVIVDNTDPAIIYHNKSQWVEYSDGIRDYRRSVSYTNIIGASLSYSFDGEAIWLYGRLCISCSSFTVSIDGSTPQRSTTSYGSQLSQQMIWSNTSLGSGRHTVTLTHDNSPSTDFQFDFIRVLGTSTLLSSSSATNFGELPTITPLIPPTNQNQTNRVLLAVGLTLGLLVLIGIVLCGVLYRRRGRRPIDLNGHSVSPYAVPPIRRTDQQSSAPLVRKGVPQPAQPSGGTMAVAEPAVLPSVTGVGPPPSYVTPNYDWRVDTAQ